jgi:hypothetical protein
MTIRFLLCVLIVFFVSGCSTPPWTGSEYPTITWAISDHTTGRTTNYGTTGGWATIVGADSFDVNMLVTDSGGIGALQVDAYILNVQCGYIVPVGHNARQVTFTSVSMGKTVYAYIVGSSNNVNEQTSTGLIMLFNSSEGGATQLCPTSYAGVTAQGQVLSGQLQIVGTASDSREPSKTSNSTLTINLTPNFVLPK